LIAGVATTAFETLKEDPDMVTPYGVKDDKFVY